MYTPCETPTLFINPTLSTLNFNTFKSSFSQNVNYLKRRFSSGDLSSEQEPEGVDPADYPGGSEGPTVTATVAQSNQPDSKHSIRQASAPTSPTSSKSILQRVQSLTGSVAKEVQSGLASGLQSLQGAKEAGFKLPKRQEGVLNLLVVDDAGTDWSKYFSTNAITLFQATFQQLQITASTEFGCLCSVNQVLFQPDLVLLRQNLRDGQSNYKNLLIGLMYGGVAAVNSLQSVYNFQDKAWVFAQLLLANRTSPFRFPLIEQVYYSSHREMTLVLPKLPGIVKIGHAHGGLGKLKVNGVGEFQDASSIVAVTGHYATAEPYIEARCNVYIQKIGGSYKAFMRKGIVGHWKSSARSAMLEQIPMNERYKAWIDSVATLFGGLDVCGIEIVVGRDSREYIIEVNDSALQLFGETQEEDRRAIAELVLARLKSLSRAPPVTAEARYYRRASSVSGEGGGQMEQAAGGESRTPPTTTREPSSSDPATEDTMKNLRKTFAGIFGDM